MPSFLGFKPQKGRDNSYNYQISFILLGKSCEVHFALSSPTFFHQEAPKKQGNSVRPAVEFFQQTKGGNTEEYGRVLNAIASEILYIDKAAKNWAYL